MTNGLHKDRMTYFHENGIAYQAFNTINGGAKILVYVKIDPQYVLCNEFTIDHAIANVEELELIAIENEALRDLTNN